MTAALELKDVKKAYQQGENRQEVLRGVNLVIQPGEVIALVAPSGAGKTTLLQIAGLLDRPDTGEVWLGGDAVGALDDASRSRKRRGSLGFIFQFHHLLPEFTALENVIVPQTIAGLSKNEAKSRGQGLLAMLGLADRVSHKPSALSGGEQQRVAIARALANAPKVVLADEPTGNLDHATAIAVTERLLQLSHGAGVGMLVATHNPELAGMMDRIVRMEDGILVDG
jgi:lipoprotein-releasing system ATP-binding protein